jgi:hypothetical protein
MTGRVREKGGAPSEEKGEKSTHVKREGKERIPCFSSRGTKGDKRVPCKSYHPFFLVWAKKPFFFQKHCFSFGKTVFFPETVFFLLSPPPPKHNQTFSPMQAESKKGNPVSKAIKEKLKSMFGSENKFTGTNKALPHQALFLQWSSFSRSFLSATQLLIGWGTTKGLGGVTWPLSDVKDQIEESAVHLGASKIGVTMTFTVEVKSFFSFRKSMDTYVVSTVWMQNPSMDLVLDQFRVTKNGKDIVLANENVLCGVDTFAWAS